jgi:CheY-like chemotaxis protein
MALILLVDDRSPNREYLATLLRSGGHSVAEARDGAEALESARSLQPDLIITDVLMPKIDGYVFVRQLRADADGRHVPVIFLTAHYEDDEIRKLAASCGVFHVITKPAEPETILEAVSRALHERSTVSDAQYLEHCDQEHLRLLTDKLARKAEQLEIANSRLRALVELGQRLGTERDPRFLLSSFCHAAGEIHSARFTILMIVDEGTSDLKHVIVSADEPDEAGRIDAAAVAERLMHHFFGRRQVLVINDMTRQPYRDHFPEDLTKLGALIVAPIQTSTYRFGLLCMAGLESGADDVSLPKVAGSMGSVLAIAYENALRYEQIDNHAEQLRVEVTERGYGVERDDIIACLDCASGWGEALMLLKFYLEHGVPIYDMVSAGNFEGGDFNIIRPGVALVGDHGQGHDGRQDRGPRQVDEEDEAVIVGVRLRHHEGKAGDEHAGRERRDQAQKEVPVGPDAQEIPVLAPDKEGKEGQDDEGTQRRVEEVHAFSSSNILRTAVLKRRGRSASSAFLRSFIARLFFPIRCSTRARL